MSKIDERKEANAYVIANQSFIDSVVASYSKKHGEETPEHYEVSNMINGRPVDFNDNSYFENAKAEEAQVENQRRRLANQRRKPPAFTQTEQVSTVEQNYINPSYNEPGYSYKNQAESTINQSAEINAVAMEESQEFQQTEPSTVNSYDADFDRKPIDDKDSVQGQNQTTSVTSIDFDELAKAREELVQSGLVDDNSYNNAEENNSNTGDDGGLGQTNGWFADFGAVGTKPNQEQSNEENNYSQEDVSNDLSGQSVNDYGYGESDNGSEQTENLSTDEDDQNVNNWFNEVNGQGKSSVAGDEIKENASNYTDAQYYENPQYYQDPQLSGQNDNSGKGFAGVGGGFAPDTTKNNNFNSDFISNENFALNNAQNDNSNQDNNGYLNNNNNQDNNGYLDNNSNQDNSSNQDSNNYMDNDSNQDDNGSQDNDHNYGADKNAVSEFKESNNFSEGNDDAKNSQKNAPVNNGSNGGTAIISGADLMAEIEAIKNANQDLFANNNEIVIEEDSDGDGFDF